jgi:SPP1 family phage portal protein
LPQKLTDDAFGKWMDTAQTHPRISYYDDYEHYYLGQFDNVPVPEHIQKALNNDVAVHANISRIVVDIKTQYLCGSPVGITVTSEVKNDALVEEAEKALYTIYKNNGLIYRNILKAIRVLSKKGDVFLKVEYSQARTSIFSRVMDKIKFWQNYRQNRLNNIKIRVLNPSFVFPKYSDSDYEELDFVAIKYYKNDEYGIDNWYAEVWYPDVVQKWQLGKKDDTLQDISNTEKAEEQSQQWIKIEENPNRYGFIPVVPIANTIDDREFGISDLQDVAEIQNMLNKALTDLMLGMDYQSFQRIFIAGAMTPQGKQWDTSAGIISELPNADAKVTVIDPPAMTAHLDAIDMLKRTLCEVTQIPQIAIGMVEGGIPSGYALRIHYMPLEAKANETRAILKDAFAELNQMIFDILELEGIARYSELDTELQLEGGLPVDDLTLVQVQEKKITMGTLSKETAMQQQGIEDIDAELDRIKSEEYDVYGDTGERANIEARNMEKMIAGLNLTGTANTEEVTPSGIANQEG